MNRVEYEGSQAQKLASHFCLTKQALAADQNAIRHLGFAGDTERFEMFAKVAQDQKAELKHKVFDALLDQGLEATGLALDTARSLNPWNVNKAADTLKAKGFGDARVIAALRHIARQKGKPAIAAAYHDFSEAAKSAKEGWSTGSGMTKDPEYADLQLLVGALKIMQGNYELGLAVTTAELGESLAYLTYVSGQVSDLTRLSDDKLSRLTTLTERLRGHVNDMKKTKQDWQKSIGNAGEPTCSS
jgi:hypothetical protein